MIGQTVHQHDTNRATPQDVVGLPWSISPDTLSKSRAQFAVGPLTSGPFVTPKAATIVITSDEVVGMGDNLFSGHAGQTWRYHDV